MSRKKLGISITIFSILVMLVGSYFYVNDYYHVDSNSLSLFTEPNNVEKTEENGDYILSVNETTKGFIFYPGGKVETEAYLPLMNELASKGVQCILIDMPLHLAVLDSNAAEAYIQRYSQIKDWYIGGHSLGGAMAASYASKHHEQLTGLVLLGAYSTSDLSNTNLEILSLYGSEDKIMNQQKYQTNKANLSKDFSELVIDGGCHSYFGAYGLQDGDGTPTISITQQIDITVDTILQMIHSNKQ